ncbi:unnamed protein product [Caretta caretta]
MIASSRESKQEDWESKPLSTRKILSGSCADVSSLPCFGGTFCGRERRADFKILTELSIDLQGKILLLSCPNCGEQS